MTTDHHVDAGLAQIRIRGHDQTVIVSIDGELDVSNVATVQSTVVRAMRGGARGLVIDFTAVSYMDSSTVAMVLMFASEMTMKRGRLELVAPPDGQVRRVLHYAGVIDQLELRDCMDVTTVNPPVTEGLA